MSEEAIVDVDEKSDVKEDENSLPTRKTYRCAYCKKTFPNLVLVQKHIKVCPSNPNNP